MTEMVFFLEVQLKKMRNFISIIQQYAIWNRMKKIFIFLKMTRLRQVRRCWFQKMEKSLIIGTEKNRLFRSFGMKKLQMPEILETRRSGKRMKSIIWYLEAPIMESRQEFWFLKVKMEKTGIINLSVGKRLMVIRWSVRIYLKFVSSMFLSVLQWEFKMMVWNMRISLSVHWQNLMSKPGS